MMAAAPRAKFVQRIFRCGQVRYVSKMLKIGSVFFWNSFGVMDLLLGTVYIYEKIHTDTEGSSKSCYIAPDIIMRIAPLYLVEQFEIFLHQLFF